MAMNKLYLTIGDKRCIKNRISFLPYNIMIPQEIFKKKEYLWGNQCHYDLFPEWIDLNHFSFGI